MMVYPELSRLVIDAVIAVHKGLGSGLLEAPYHRALVYKLESFGLMVDCQVPFKVMFEGQKVGEYFADLVVQNRVLVEVKSVQTVTPVMQAQVINYLKISGLQLGFLVNFQGVKAEWLRFVNGVV